MSHPTHQWVDYDPTAGTVPASYTLDRELSRAKAEAGPEKWARLQAEWNDPDFVFDAFGAPVMNIDKFLTDLAAHAGAHTVQIEWRQTDYPPLQFEVSLYYPDATKAHGWELIKGTGITVDAAMLAAIAKLRTSRALDELDAIDGELLS